MASIQVYAKPRFLYRYRPIKNLHREVEAIERKYIVCSTYKGMNDPMEGLYRATRRVCERDDYDSLVREIRNEKLGLGIASFCEAWDNELMWAHYAEGFRGICVAYSMARLIECLPPGFTLARVVYNDRPYDLDLADQRDRADRARAVLSTKNSRWAYEREWRLFSPCSGEAYYRADAVAHVYLGARFPRADIPQIRRRLETAGLEVRSTQVDGYCVEMPSSDALS